MLVRADCLFYILTTEKAGATQILVMEEKITEWIKLGQRMQWRFSSKSQSAKIQIVFFGKMKNNWPWAELYFLWLCLQNYNKHKSNTRRKQNKLIKNNLNILNCQTTKPLQTVDTESIEGYEPIS